MWRRADNARAESDTAFFFDLMYLGELVVKLVVLGIVSFLSEDRERQRYAVERTLASANGIGEWVTALEEVLTGPVSQLLSPAAAPLRREVMQKWSAREGAWQRTAFEQLERVSRTAGASADATTARVSLLRWFQVFAWLRKPHSGPWFPDRTKLLNYGCRPGNFPPAHH
jgi:hypothetical protein